MAYKLTKEKIVKEVVKSGKKPENVTRPND